MKRLACILIITVILTGCSKGSKENKIEDFLLEKLKEHRILVIPEWLSHDSFESIELTLRLIKRWAENDHGIKNMILGIETEKESKEIELLKKYEYYKFSRWGTICPQGWGLISTRQINGLLFYQQIKDKFPERFHLFGFEPGFHYYDRENDKYLLPNQIGELKNIVEVPILKSTAPPELFYIYSTFFRDYLSFSRVDEIAKTNPESHIIIVIGSGHSIKQFPFSLTEERKKIAEKFGIETDKYCQTLGNFLGKSYNPLFVASRISDEDAQRTLRKYAQGQGKLAITKSNEVNLDEFYVDYIYNIPKEKQTNREEVPLLVIPSVTNLSLLENNHYQVYFEDQYLNIAKKLVYFFTGIVPKINSNPFGLGADLINPETNQKIDFKEYKKMVLKWYADGTYLKRLKEDIAFYNHRNLFGYIFQLMDKRDFTTLTRREEALFMNYIMAILTVIGDPEEKQFALSHLNESYGKQSDQYCYFKKLFSERYNLD
jgi:hypothetical protein